MSPHFTSRSSINGLCLLTSVLAIIGLFSLSAQADTKADISATMGGLAKFVQEKTAPENVQEKSVDVNPAGEEKYRELKNDLETCSTKEIAVPRLIEIQQDGVSSKFKAYDVIIGGDNCPLEIHSSVNSISETIDHIEADILLSVQFKTAALVEKYHFKSAEAKGKIVGAVTKNGTTIIMPTQVAIDTQMVSAEGNHIQQGLKIEATVNVNLASFQFGLLMIESGYQVIADKKDEFKGRTEMVGFGSITQKYEINNKQVSASEYKTFLQSFFVSGQVEEDENTAPDSRVSTRCMAVVYEKSSIKAELLKSQLISGQLQTQGKIHQVQTCNKNLSTSFNANGETYSSGIQYLENWMSFDVKSAQRSPEGIYIIYGDKEPLVSENEYFMMGLQCVPASCP